MIIGGAGFALKPAKDHLQQGNTCNKIPINKASLDADFVAVTSQVLENLWKLLHRNCPHNGHSVGHVVSQLSQHMLSSVIGSVPPCRIYCSTLSCSTHRCFGFQSIEQLSPWSWKGPIFSASVEDSATIHAFGG